LSGKQINAIIQQHGCCRERWGFVACDKNVPYSLIYAFRAADHTITSNTQTLLLIQYDIGGWYCTVRQRVVAQCCTVRRNTIRNRRVITFRATNNDCSSSLSVFRCTKGNSRALSDRRDRDRRRRPLPPSRQPPIPAQYLQRIILARVPSSLAVARRLYFARRTSARDSNSSDGQTSETTPRDTPPAPDNERIQRDRGRCADEGRRRQ